MRGAATLLTLGLAALVPFDFAAQPAQGPFPSSRRVVGANLKAADQTYSPAILVGKTLYLAGQLGRHPETQQLPAGIRDQTRHAMDRMGAVLRAAGMAHENLVKCHVYLASMDDYAGMNETYRAYFPGRVPARTTVEAAGLPQGAAVEISCIAFADASGISVVRPEAGSLPAPLGPYSAAVWAGDTLYLSGMGGQFPDGRALPESLAGQVTQTLANVGTTLKAAGLNYSDIVAGEAYVTVPEEAETLDPAYRVPFPPSSAHARAIVFVPRLPGAIKAELTMVAARSTVARRVIAPIKGDVGARAVLAGGVLYTRTESAAEAGPGFEEQYRKILERQEATLRDAGLRWSDVVDVQMYLTDLGDMDALNRMFREKFPKDPPARSTIRVLSRGARVQSSLVAVSSAAR
jgi:reactive intermediate/imine deaminase